MLARDTDTADLSRHACSYHAKERRPEVSGARFAPSVSVAQLFGLFVTVKK